MKHLVRFLISAMCLLILMVCKSNFSGRIDSKAEKANPADIDDINGRPDKLSEEPVGLPGYPLVCRWQDAPTESTPTANLRCYLTDKSGEPTNLGVGALWAVENVTPDLEVIQKVVGLEFHISVSGLTDVIVLDALRTLQVRVQYGPTKNLEKKAPISDLLRAQNNAFRLASTCDGEFVAIVSREENSIMVGPVFPGCEELAASLNNRMLPDLSVNPTFLASCEENIFRFDPVEDGPPEIIESDLLVREYCLELAVFINSKGEQ
ncbi:MAG: hypothetical protein M3Q07_19825 [Pseudobdellovibrionaceae bacterium]|nr:hypothetical protein [Pseudobdellovibrionaceae bacterium]